MKQFFLSFAAMLLFATTSFAQAQVEVFNNMASCDVDVTVTSYNCNGLGGSAAVISTYGPFLINAGNSFVFSEIDPNVVDFRINVVGSSTNPPPTLTFMSDTHVWSPSCLILPLTVGASSSACGGPNGNVVVLPDMTTAGAFPNGIVYIDPN